jgi:thioredoxin 1
MENCVMKIRQDMFITSLFLLLFGFLGCNKNESQSKAGSTNQQVKATQTDSTGKKENPKVTFVELGSNSCIPCKMMQPVMEAVEEEFGEQLKVVFHDVWKDNTPAQKYGVKLIPTQVFLDSNGVEFFRHEGFLPKETIEKLLVENGLRILKQVEIKK